VIGRLAPVWWDRAAGVVFLALCLVDLAGHEGGGNAAQRAGTLALELAICTLIPLRRTRPWLAVWAWAGLVVALVFVAPEAERLAVPVLGLFFFPYATAAHAEGWRALSGLGAIVVAVTAIALASPGFLPGDIFFPAAFGSVFWLAGWLVRSHARLTEELHEAALAADEAGEAEALRAMAEERRRIAREMHDVVAHSVSMMVVQAGGARRIMQRDPARAAAAAALIERTGREALTEMRTLLGVLHATDPGEAPAAYAPQPGLGELEALVERTRAAGVPVALQVSGERRALPAGVELAAYRLVQEALTNVVKHSGGAATEVEVDFAEDAVAVRVADRGAGPATVRLEGAGQGLAGMRERVRVYGGSLEAGRRRGGGFEVRARLPLQGQAEAALAAGARP
jgi:signal transduction histidine kinase